MMKRIVLALSLVIACAGSVQGEKNSPIKDLLQQHVARKIAYLQELIHFSPEQASRLKAVELDYWYKVLRVECCKCCNAEKQLKKLEAVREAELQKILQRDEYIKYSAIEHNRIKEFPLRIE